MRRNVYCVLRVLCKAVKANFLAYLVMLASFALLRLCMDDWLAFMLCRIPSWSVCILVLMWRK